MTKEMLLFVFSSRTGLQGCSLWRTQITRLSAPAAKRAILVIPETDFSDCLWRVCRKIQGYNICHNHVPFDCYSLGFSDFLLPNRSSHISNSHALYTIGHKRLLFFTFKQIKMFQTFFYLFFFVWESFFLHIDFFWSTSIVFKCALNKFSLTRHNSTFWKDFKTGTKT